MKSRSIQKTHGIFLRIIFLFLLFIVLASCPCQLYLYNQRLKSLLKKVRGIDVKKIMPIFAKLYIKYIVSTN